jgi:hypothetical protein
MKTQLVATVGGGFILTVLQMLTGMVLGPLDVEMPPGTLPWMLLANLLLAGVLAWYARRSAWTGWRLAAALFAISYGIGHASALIELYFFPVLPRPGLLQGILVSSLVPAVLISPVMVWLAGRWSRAGAAPAMAPERSATEWMARFAACCVAYVLLYFAAGMIIFPYVQAFYAQLTLPAVSTVIMLQLFVRGPLFVAIGFLIVRMAPATRMEHALAVGIAMSVLGGVVPLLVPNPFFPDYVRWAHLAEVVSSNLVFGCTVGWLLSGPGRAEPWAPVRREERSAAGTSQAV